MSILSVLEAKNFRNLSHVKIEPHPEINIFYGENGSGKTSLLEAIYHLGFARSFRTRHIDRVLMQGKERFHVFGNIDSLSTGVEKCKNGDMQIRVNREDIRSVSELALHFPLQLINQDSYHIVTGGPKSRRQFLDWGVFHVEPQFFLMWKKLQHVLKQRNAALRAEVSNKSGRRCGGAAMQMARLWDDDLVEMSCELSRFRRAYFEKYCSKLMRIVSTVLPGVSDLELEFYPGWHEGKELDEVLEEDYRRDMLLGYTQHGAHRADIRILVEKKPLQDVLSRGQQKLFVCVMLLLQGILLKDSSLNKSCAFLIDDLPSELDQNSLHVFCDLFSELPIGQAFITGIARESFESLFSKTLSKRMFHVKQGMVDWVDDNLRGKSV